MTIQNQSTPEITFIVPCYNYGRFLPDCLASIFGQKGNFHYEVIVIDDASTDDTQVRLRSYDDPRLRIVINQINKGHAETLTTGLHLARGKYVARIDPDDRYRADFLNSTITYFEQYPEVGLVYGDAAIINSSGEITTSHSDQIHKDTNYKGNELIALLADNFICAPTVIARREAWLNALPIPDGLVFNDWYFTLMMARNHEFYYVNQVLADYRVHGQNWHTLIARNKSEETSIMRLLDQIFAETEKSETLEVAKHKAQRQIYATHYRVLGDKYFGHQQMLDARRCYWKTLHYQPHQVFHQVLIRHLIGTYMEYNQYEKIRNHVKSVLVKP